MITKVKCLPRFTENGPVISDKKILNFLHRYKRKISPVPGGHFFFFSFL